jgi:hypothetical protein
VPGAFPTDGNPHAPGFGAERGNSVSRWHLRPSWRSTTGTLPIHGMHCLLLCEHGSVRGLWIEYDLGKTHHVVVWKATHGPVPNGRELDHVRGRGCGHKRKLSHLEVVTHAENMERVEHCNLARPTASGTTHSMNKYGYTRRGKRVCKTCDREKRRSARNWT